MFGRKFDPLEPNVGMLAHPTYLQEDLWHRFGRRGLTESDPLPGGETGFVLAACSGIEVVFIRLVSSGSSAGHLNGLANVKFLP
jgi:hypothetical protein